MNFLLLRKLAVIGALIIFSGFVGYKLGTNEVKVAWQKYLPNVSVVNKLPPNRPVDFSLFWSVWDELEKKYVDKTKLDSQKMVYGAISGMVAALGDPYTVFLPPEANKESKGELNGSFEGIGAQLGVKDKRIVVIAPLLDSPAQKAGVRTGDWIIKVDGKQTANWTLPEAVAKIRGPKGSTVTLDILHQGDEKPVDITIRRDTIILKSVEWKIVSPATASANLKPAVYLALSRFGERTDPQWDKAVSEIANYFSTPSASAAGIILDVRNNPGGFLAGAVYTGSEFLSEGVIVKQESYTGEVATYSVNRRGKLLDPKIVVLVNQGTASAAEILAGALQAAKRATIIGEKTFGKGSVQEAEDLPGGAGLHITTAKWLLSNGIWINSTGLTPDIKIEDDEKTPADEQVEKAIAALNPR